MFKKCLSILLGILLMVVSFSVQPFTVLAQEVDIMEDGANVELTSVGGNYGVNLSHAGYQSPPNPYAYPQCTWYCWGRAYEKLGLSLPGWGHANTWDESADANPNFTVGTEARANSIMVEKSTGVGHVMFVEKVENGYAYITEGNYLSSSYHEDRINLSRMVRDSWTTHQLSSVRYIYLSNPEPATNAWLNIDRSEIVTGESVTFNFGADNANGFYTIGIDKGINRIVTENIKTNSFSYTFNEAGDYSAYVTCYGDGGLADTNRVYFKVYERISALNAWIKLNHDTVEQGQSITFTYGADHSNGYYTIGIDKGNKRIHTENIKTTSYTYTFNETGDYSAYVTCYGYGGLADTERVYFTVTKPYSASNAWITIDKDAIEKGDSITFSYGADHSNGYFTIGIDKGDKRIHTKDIQTNSYTYTFSEAGDYSAYVTCYGNAGLADTERVNFKVYDKFPALNAWIKTDNERIEKGQTIIFTYGADHSNGYYTIGIDKDNKRIHTKDIQTTIYQYAFNEVGNYSAYVTCYGDGGLADTERVYITVYEDILGDVDDDGNVEIRDSTWIQRHVTKEEMPFVINKTTADVDGDGIITVMDATAIQYYLANIKTSYKIGEKIE